MDIIKVEIENCLTIKEASLELSNKGLVLVQGENIDDTSADSNGAGKSSIPDALCWALYGITARGIKGDDVVNNIAKKECRVAVTIADSGKEYVVTRHRKHSKGKNNVIVTQVGAAEPLTKGTDKMTQIIIDQIIGCSYEVFSAAIYAGQEAMPNLPAMTDKQLKMLIEESAGIELLQSAHKIALIKSGDAKRELIDIDAKKSKADALVAMQSVNLADMEQNEKEWVDKQKQMVNIAKRNAIDSVARAKDVASEINPAEEAELRNKVDDYDSQIRSQDKERVEERRFQTKVDDAVRYEGAIKAGVVATANKIKTLRVELDSLNSKIGTPCGECGKAYEERDMSKAGGIITRKIKTEIVALEQVKLDYSEASESAESARAKLSTFRESMTDVSKVIDAQRACERRIAEIVQKQTTLRAHKDDAKRHAEEAKRISLEVNPYTKMRANLKADLDIAAKKIKGIKADLKNQEKKSRLLIDAVDVFGQSGVRAHILDTVTPFLNEKTAEYLGQLSDGNITAIWSTLTLTKSKEYREKFNIAVSNTKGAKSFAGLSGGEKRKVRIATAMALQDLVASRATKPIGLFIADEVDDALDTSGLERLMGILDQKARDKGTVLVISHNSLSDWIREVVTVTKENGVSTVSGVLCD